MSRNNEKIRRPLLRYHGGKWILAPWIISHFPLHRIYVEPYGGAASVLLRKPPSEVEVYNDLQEDLVAMFRVLRDKEKAAELARLLALTPWARDEQMLALERSDDPVENTRRLIVCSHMSIGTDTACNRRHTGFRNYAQVHKIGSVPVQTWLSMPETIRLVVERLQGRCIIENCDALKTMAQHDSVHTLHYVDPPYVKETRGI